MDVPITTEMVETILKKLSIYYHGLKQFDLQHADGFEADVNPGQVNQHLSPRLEHFAKIVLSKHFKEVQRYGGTGEPDLIVDGKTLEFKLTGTDTFQTEIAEVKKYPHGLDHIIFMVDDLLMNAFVVYVPKVTELKCRPEAPGAKGKVKILREVVHDTGKVLYGKWSTTYRLAIQARQKAIKLHEKSLETVASSHEERSLREKIARAEKFIEKYAPLQDNFVEDKNTFRPGLKPIFEHNEDKEDK